MIKDFQFKDRYEMEDLLVIMEKLRGEGGCPWDAEQTHESIRKNFIEETYEVLEAIDNQDSELLKEELGDVLMQVAFHTQIEKEAGHFVFNDVCDGVCKKLIERHPHVFGDVTAETTDVVLKNWDEIKKKKKGQQTQTEVIRTIPRQLPALMRAAKVQQKAAKVGFDFECVSDTLDKLEEEIAELREAIAKKDEANVKEELGDLFFAGVNVSRFVNEDAEEALTGATDKFVERFAIVERLARERGVQMEQASLEELDVLWDEAKGMLKSK